MIIFRGSVNEMPIENHHEFSVWCILERIGTNHKTTYGRNFTCIKQ